MKTLKQIRYILFALMVIGCFANFAQNEYGLTIYYHSCFLVGFTLLIDAFYYIIKKNQTQKTYLIAESFLLGMFFISLDAKNMHWNYSNAIMILSIGFLCLLYLILALKILFKEFKKGKLLAIGIFFVIINTLAAIGFNIFKIMHWPGTIIILWSAATMTIFQVLFFIFRRKYSYKGEKITLLNKMLKLPGKLPMTYCYFTIFVIHFSLFIWGIAPNFYILRIPPAMQKMNEENNPKAQIYGHNLDTFWENRDKAEESSK